MRHARSDYNRFQDPEGKIPEDEPVFLIRGQDRVAAQAVLVYADLAEQAGAAPELVQACRDQAKAMLDWALAHGSKIPDAPPEALSIDG